MKPMLSGELDAPQAGTAPVPLWLMIGLGVLVYWGQLALDTGAGGFHPEVYASYKSLLEVSLANPRPPADPQMEKGRSAYKLYCALCHQPDGAGQAALAPPLAGSDWVTADSPERLIRLVLHGLEGPIAVSGKSYTFQSPMPPWKDVLTDESIAAVLTFIRRNPDWNHRAAAVAPTQVSALRQAEAARAEPWTEELLLELP